MACVWQAAQTPPEPPKPLKHGAIAYFRDHCQRCHGAFGGAYEDDFTKGKTLAELTDVIKSMAAGQGGSPLTDSGELGAQVSFHYAIDKKRPFLDWTGQDGNVLTGEVTPDAKVDARYRLDSLDVQVKDGMWKLTLPPGGEAGRVQIRASIKDVTSCMDLSKLPYSPIPIPNTDKKEYPTTAIGEVKNLSKGACSLPGLWKR